MPDRPFLLFLKKGRSLSSTQRRCDRPFGCECFCREARSPFMYTRCQTCDRPFGISQKVRCLGVQMVDRPFLHILKKGRSLFWDEKGDRDTFTSHIAQISCFSSSFLLTKSKGFYHGILDCCQSLYP
jgi:hypothetical protein